jgi:hypothetical protein
VDGGISGGCRRKPADDRRAERRPRVAVLRARDGPPRQITRRETGRPEARGVCVTASPACERLRGRARDARCGRAPAVSRSPVWGEQTLASDSQRRPRRSPSSCVRARTCPRCATLPRRRRPAVVSAWSPHSRPDVARISRPTARSSRPSSTRESRKGAAPRRLAAACAGAPRKAPRRLIRGWIAAHGGVEAGHDLDHALIHSLLSVMRHIATRLLRASEPSSFLAGSDLRLLSALSDNSRAGR